LRCSTPRLAEWRADVTDEAQVRAWDAVLAVNAKGPFLGAKYAARHLEAAEHAAIVLLGSDSSVVDTPMARDDLARPEGLAGVEFPVQSAEDVARQVAFLLSPASAPVNGTQLVSDHGYLARSGFPA
jgi:NAD(P)-dependent dehydrogenase (short-subunit alcohol dehydrogenase family)